MFPSTPVLDGKSWRNWSLKPVKCREGRDINYVRGVKNVHPLGKYVG